MRLSIQSRLFMSHFVAVVLVSGSIGTLFYYSATSTLFHNLQSRLRNSAAMLSRTLDARVIGHLRSAEDVGDPAYRENLAMLREFQRSNEDIAFIYVMRRERDQVYFVIDSDPTDEQALPGQPYREDMPSLQRGFASLTADDEILCDRWGCFLSGYAPIKNGDGHFLVGIDMRADEVQRKFEAIRLTGLASLVASIALAWVFSTVLASRITRPIRLLAHRSREIADGKLEGRVEITSSDEIGALADAFNTMSERLGESDRRNRHTLADLEDARASLEDRVVERTAALAQEIEERKRAEAALEVAASTDYLTGLLNRRAMFAVLGHELERARRSGHGCSLVLLDLDHFKEVNDRCGHEAGDRVLAQVAALLQNAVRGQDAVARWGGEELLVLLPETALAGAVEVAEKIRARFAAEVFTADGVDLALTVSAGVVVVDLEAEVDESIRRADAAMYRAKAEGRNRLVVG